LEIQIDVNDHEYNQNQLELFTGNGTVIYDRTNKLHENRFKFLDKVFRRNLHDTSTKLTKEQYIYGDDYVDQNFNVSYKAIFLREYQLLNSYTFIVQYESGQTANNEGVF
jgi:hypothetical protein